MASPTQLTVSAPANGFPVPPQAVLELHLHVIDPEVIAELEKNPAGSDRERFALSALRLGVLALRQARGELDASVVREAGQKILHDLESLLKDEGSKLTGNLAVALKQYFDKDSGELPRRLESLLKQDGEFERFLRQHLGPDTSTLAQTLNHHLQPILRLLDPQEAQGVQARIQQLLDKAIQEQRNQVLREFSLDSNDSALARLLHKVTDENGKLTKDVRGLVDELAEEFSLDKEDSALSRLVKKVEDAQGLIGKSLTLDDENSPLSRLKRELQVTIDGLTKSNSDFQAKVLEALAKLQAQRETAAKSTLPERRPRMHRCNHRGDPLLQDWRFRHHPGTRERRTERSHRLGGQEQQELRIGGGPKRTGPGAQEPPGASWSVCLRQRRRARRHRALRPLRQ